MALVEEKRSTVNSNKYYDHEGNLARKGSINKIILNQSLENFYDNQISSKKSFDISDFDLSFVRGLSLEDGAATLTEFTGHIISEKIITLNFLLHKNQRIKKIIACGGGRKNKSLMKKIFSKTHPVNLKIDIIDKYGIDGDFIESQAFAFLAIRSYLKLPISFPNTTGCKKPSVGGLIIKTFKKE